MRFLHTADWHLGRLFHGVHLTDDQAGALDGLCDLVKQSNVQAVVIAGDIYDRSVPPPEAVELCDEILSRLALEMKVAVILIAGNHDSPQRLHFASRLMRRGSVHVFGRLSPEIGQVTLEDSDGPVHFLALPYAEPATVRHCHKSDASCHDSAMRCCVERINAQRREGRRVLIAHAFVDGAAESESERPLSIGGAGVVNVDAFAGFDYVALGHLHRPQAMAQGRVRYAGSLMKYSFSEADDRKSAVVVEMDASGAVSVESVALKSRRDTRIIQGALQAILDGAAADPGREDYLHVVLEDSGATLNAFARLRERYPNVMSMQRRQAATSDPTRGPRVDHNQLGDLELFNAFFQEVSGEPMDRALTDAFIPVAEALRSAEREATL